MNRLNVNTASIEKLELILPRLLQNVSLSRAQIAIDQLRGAIQSGGRDRVLLVTATEDGQPDTIFAAAVAIQQPGIDREMATVVHAGAILEADDNTQHEWMKALHGVFEDQLEHRGVRFAQWATDPGDEQQSVASWCRGLGFQPIGTLDYLKGDVDPGKFATDVNASLEYQAVDANSPSQYDAFVEQVESTYEQTLDCPALASYRTSAETLRGYRASTAYDPSGWFRVVEREASGQIAPVGCLILGLHQPQRKAVSEPNAANTSPVLEVVYMGIVPTARGRGLGNEVIAHAMMIAQQKTAKQIILAVDQNNVPARNIYSRAGMSEMLSETVWVRSLS
ncbi:MAG: GNAT family N-acetyltransferase [Planctomycetota bacterium]